MWPIFDIYIKFYKDLSFITCTNSPDWTRHNLNIAHCSFDAGFGPRVEAELTEVEALMSW